MMGQPQYNAPITIYAMGCFIGGQHLWHAQQVPICLLYALLPSIVGGTRDLEVGTHGLHFILLVKGENGSILRLACHNSCNSAWYFFSSATSIRSRTSSLCSFSTFRFRPRFFPETAPPSRRYS